MTNEKNLHKLEQTETEKGLERKKEKIRIVSQRMADKWGWKLPEMRIFEVRPEAGRVKRKKWVVRHGSCTLCRRKEEGRCALKVKWNHGAISSLSEMKQLRF